MLAILGGLGAALAWGTSTLAASRSSRILPSSAVLAWVSLTGLVLAVPAVLLAPNPGPSLADVPLLVLAGAGGAIGLLVTYSALRVGQVAIIAPIVSAEGAIAAGIAILAGDRVAPTVGIALAVVAIGVALASREHAGDTAVGAAAGPELIVPLRPRRAVALAIVAACCFGVGLWSTGRVGSVLAIGWALLPARVAGGLVVPPLLARRRLHRPGRATRFVVLGGVCEILGTVSFVIGAAEAPAVASVLAAQFAAVAVAGGWLIYRERLDRSQLTGVALLVAGTTAIALLRA